nr:Dihydrofolate reductase [uncultured bacterium]
MIISLVAAMSENRVIGIDNKLPWNIPVDMKRFRDITRGHVVVMGRKTFESLGKPLPQRTNIVITRNRDWTAEGATVVHSLEEALAPYKNSDEEVFVIGGGEIYDRAIEIADRIYLTVVHKNFQGDAYFPEFDSAKFDVFHEEKHNEPIPFTFIDYQRKNDRTKT